MKSDVPQGALAITIGGARRYLAADAAFAS
jgi:hypothetical protein